MRRLLIALAVLFAIGALATAHIAYWYLPRARAVRPDSRSPVAGLLAQEQFPAVLWLPYPHQNLGVLDPANPRHQDYLAAFARLTGLPPVVLPSFGGFPVVPSSELALAADTQGESFVVMAQVYPALAAFSRLAGRLADNPWLAGGPVTVRGRSAKVSWQGNVWMVRQAGAPPLELRAPSPAATRASALGVLALHRPIDPFPAGIYRLRADGTRLAVTSERSMQTALWQRAGAIIDRELVLLMMAGPGSRHGVQALAFFRREPAAGELPRAAVLERSDGVPDHLWRVPGASLARLSGGLRQGQAAGWKLRALGRRGLDAARGLAPRAAAVAATRPAADGVLVWGLWADLGNTRDEVARLARLAERLPLIPRREARRWRDAEIVLAPVADRFRALTVVVAGAPPALRLELARRPALLAPSSGGDD